MSDSSENAPVESDPAENTPVESAPVENAPVESGAVGEGAVAAAVVDAPERQVHEVREMAESFGADADRYDRARPRYPVALLQRVLAAGPGAAVPDVLAVTDVPDVPDVLDVGVGTGIVARQLLALGCRVLGVDIDARMVEAARQSGVEAEVAAFEAWDPAGRTFDAVVSGQAWHWLDPRASASRAAAVLRPGGRLAVFWNLFQPTRDVAVAFDEVYRRILPENTGFSWTRSALDGYAPILDKTTAAIRAEDGLGEPEQWQFTWEHRYSRAAWLDQVPTFGNSGLMPPDKLAGLLDGLGSVIDELGGAFTMPYTTVAITALRAG